MNMEDDDPDYLELALTFYLYLNDMDGDYLDDHGYSREKGPGRGEKPCGRLGRYRTGDPGLMRREVTLEEISDGRLYEANDMVKAVCQDCKGCFDCCTGMGDSVVLDPLDVWRLSQGLGLSVDQLLAGKIELGVTDGNILPHLKMAGAEERCVFLDGNGRCSIHSFRPGFCRLFPLGRYYEDGGFKYILQIHECKKTSRSKIRGGNG